MAKRSRQVGGSKEAPLAVVGHTDNKLQPRIIVLEDAEFEHYWQLFQGFFAKLTRWQSLLQAQDEFISKHSPRTRFFNVVNSPNGFQIVGEILGENFHHPSPKKILYINNHTAYYNSEHEDFNTSFLIRPGLAGTQLLVDPEGRPLQEIHIELSDFRFREARKTLQSLRIDTEYPPHEEGKPNRHEAVVYETGKGNAEIKKWLFHPLISEAYQIHLFQTIDSLIPGTTPQQPGRKPTPELQTPRQLPAPRRRSPRG